MQGSVEAIVGALDKLVTDEIQVRVLQSGVGAHHRKRRDAGGGLEGAPIIGFNVRANAKAREVAERGRGRDPLLRRHLHLTDEIAQAMAGELGPEIIENVVGRAEISEVFPAGKKDKAAGLLVVEGVIRKGLHARLTRDDVIVYKTTIASLRRFKDDVAEVRAGLECGVMLADTNDIKPGDIARDVRGRGTRTDALTRCMQRNETPEGRSVRLLRVGEQVRHVLSEILMRGEVHDETLASHLVGHRGPHVARSAPRDGVRETAARQRRGSRVQGAAHPHRLSPARGRAPREHQICREAQIPAPTKASTRAARSTRCLRHPKVAQDLGQEDGAEAPMSALYTALSCSASRHGTPSCRCGYETATSASS